MANLTLHFDANLDYQLDAIQAVVDVFDGLPRRTAEYALGDEIVPNLPDGYTLDEQLLEDNVRLVQKTLPANTHAALPAIRSLDVEEGLILEWVGNHSHRYPHFTVEMETGTGKTYVYLRTIHELFQNYGFRKFIIVVPSIAIYEGVVKTFDITRTHFRALYGNETINLTRYEGDRLSTLRAFATSTFIEIMVMTIDSFNKKTNKIYRASEQLPGELLPFEFIQRTRPILILDEPQNMGSERAQEALRTLSPLFALRYSATHRETPNLLYQLTPFEAFRRNLVKRILVDGVTALEDFGQASVALLGIDRSRNEISARVRAYKMERGAAKEEEITLRRGDDLYARTRHDLYRHGWRVSEINYREGFLEFENGTVLRGEDTLGPTKEAIFRVQIERTVQRHMERQHQLLDQGIKVLSLFFIDRVANYIEDEGIIRRHFIDAYNKCTRTAIPSFKIKPSTPSTQATLLSAKRLVAKRLKHGTPQETPRPSETPRKPPLSSSCATRSSCSHSTKLSPSSSPTLP